MQAGEAVIEEFGGGLKGEGQGSVEHVLRGGALVHGSRIRGGRLEEAHEGRDRQAVAGGACGQRCEVGGGGEDMAGGFFCRARVDAADMAEGAGPFGLEPQHVVELCFGRPEGGDFRIAKERAEPRMIEHAGHGRLS